MLELDSKRISKVNNKSGIYSIFHIDSGRHYIGSAVDIARRRREHFCKLRKAIHPNAKLQNAWNKYGEESFKFVVLDRCHRKELIVEEQQFIVAANSVNGGFNILKIAGSTMGYKHTAETKAHLSLVNRGYKHTKEAKDRMRGRLISDETREALSIAHLGYVMPESQKLAIGEGNRGKERTLEHCMAISRGKTGKTRTPVTEETRQKLVLGQQKRRLREKALRDEQ